jgi:nitrogen fixation protein FixH
MALILVAFFAVVIAVNVVMARLAVGTFGGVVVENSYVASQDFNGWLKSARSEKALGWRSTVVRDGEDGLVLTLADGDGRPIDGARITGTAEHPLGVVPAIVLRVVATGAGRYRVTSAVPAGRWRLKLLVRHEAGQLHIVRDLP